MPTPNTLIIGALNRALVLTGLSLAKSSLTAEEVYQQRRELAKSYSYYGSFGFSYTFGSIFNNIVNSRFGNQGGGGTTITISE